MRLEIVTNVRYEDMDEIGREMYHASMRPYKPIMRVSVPDWNDVDREIAQTIALTQKALWGKDGSVWVKVVDREAGDKMAGVALWRYFDQAPYDGPPERPVADWYPEGDQRDFINQVLVRSFEVRKQKMNRPHACLMLAFTVAEYRQKGVGKMYMRYGIELADQKGLPAWCEATPMAVPLYEAFGFLVEEFGERRPYHPNPSKEWRYIRDKIGRIPHIQMWRPPYGHWIPGESTKPWESDAADDKIDQSL